MTIKSKPLTKEYVEGWERVHALPDCERCHVLGGRCSAHEDPAEARLVRPHDCEHCGHHMEYDDQQCGCTSYSGRFG